MNATVTETSAFILMPLCKARQDRTNVSCLYQKGCQLKIRAGSLWEHEDIIGQHQKHGISLPSPWNHTCCGFSGLIFPLRKAGLVLVSWIWAVSENPDHTVTKSMALSLALFPKLLRKKENSQSPSLPKGTDWCSFPHLVCNVVDI